MHHLSRVYLTLKRSDDDLKKALNYAEQVINSGKYSLVKSHAELWDINNKNNSEVLSLFCIAKCGIKWRLVIQPYVLLFSLFGRTSCCKESY